MAAEMERDEAEQERERARLFMEFLIAVYAQRPQGKEDSDFARERKKFVEQLKPKTKQEPRKIETKVYDWDEEMLKRLKAKQTGG